MKKAPVILVTFCLVVLVSQFVLADDTLVKGPPGQLQRPSSRGEPRDVIVLKNGNRIEGLIIKEDDNGAVIERPSAQKNQFYTARISMNDIAKILRLPPRVRESVQQHRQLSKNTQRASQDRSAHQGKVGAIVQTEHNGGKPFHPAETRPYSVSRPSSDQVRPTPAVTGIASPGRAYGGYGVGGYGGYGGGGLGAAGGYGDAGFGAGGYGGAGFGAGGYGGAGFGAGGYGGAGFGGAGFGSVTFSNILQLCVRVDHALVGEVEPVIGLGGQRSGGQAGMVR